MDGWLIVAVVVVGAVLLTLFTASRPTSTTPRSEPTDDDRVRALCAQLTGDPARDRPHMNRLLALGPSRVPLLLAVLAEGVRHEVPPALLARLEEVLADFGLAVVPEAAAALARLQPTSPLAASLLRVIHRLGRPGLTALVGRALDEPGLGPMLPRLRNDLKGLHDASGASALMGRAASHADLTADLDRTVGLLAAAARTGGAEALLDDLWAAWGSEGRATLLDWLCDWLPLARRAHLEAGLTDPSDLVRTAAARLATLLVEPTLTPALAELATSGDQAGRLAAVHALAASPHPKAAEALVQAAGDADPEVAAAAVAGLAPGSAVRLREAAQYGRALPEAAQGLLASEAPFEPGGGQPSLLMAHLGPGPTGTLALALLGRHLEHDPRVRERLIQLASSADLGALRLVASHGVPEAPELLARAFEPVPDRHRRLQLQEIAQLLGPSAAAPIARRLTGPAQAQRLAVLRATDFTDAVPALLHRLEESRDDETTLAATLALGGPGVQEALDEALRLPGRGLLPPALRFLQGYATPSDLPRLIELYDRHPPMRTILLALIELLGASALPALEARLARGGDDGVVQALERRIAVLRETTRRG